MKRIQPIEPRPFLPRPLRELHFGGGGGRHILTLVAVSVACGDDNPTAVGMGDVVEAKKLPRAPTNRRASAFVVHGLDLDIARGESRGNKKKESVAAFLGLEVSGSPRKEFVQWDGLWPTVVHKKSFWGEDSSPGYHTPEKWRADWSVGHVA